jgi:serine/threonine-protein kinase
VEGTPFGRYRLIELLGRGGMGEVWRGHDTVVDRTVAIKMLLPHFAQDKTFEQRFRREARAAARLDEPHVVPIYDVGEVDGLLYVAMRLINGQDLQTILDSGPLEADRAVGIIEQIASALQAAHKVGLVHRDVKPSNILITDDDFAYLIDFGIARAAGDTGITSTGATIGTWSYMAPERFSSEEIEPSSDIYALACVLYQSLTGHLPFPGTTLEQVAMAHMTAPPPKPSTQRREIPMAMDDVIATGLAKDPRQRYPTPKELAQAARSALDQAQTDTIMADTQAAPTSSAPGQRDTSDVDALTAQHDPGGKNAGQARLIAVAAALVAVILIAGFIVIWHPWRRGPGPSQNMPTSSRQSPEASVAKPTANAAATPPPGPPNNAGRTRLITEVAVGADGQLANGYSELPTGDSTQLSGCDTPSPAAISQNIYSCYPSAAAADICWPSPPTSMLCMTNPWDKQVRRFSYDTSLLPMVQPPKTPEPFALMLDNGTHCLYISGGARRARSDGYVPDYACGADLNSYVLGDASGSDPINRSNPTWTVTFEQPGFQTQMRSVTTAWFAGN